MIHFVPPPPPRLGIVANWRITSLQTCAQTIAHLNIAAALGQRNACGDNIESPVF